MSEYIHNVILACKAIFFVGYCAVVLVCGGGAIVGIAAAERKTVAIGTLLLTAGVLLGSGVPMLVHALGLN